MPTTKKKATTKKEVYKEAIGRRKSASARVRIYPEKKASKDYNITVNEKPYKKYFPLAKQHNTVISPFEKTGENFVVTVKVSGGGIESQTEAIRMGIARILARENEDWKKKMRSYGYLTRDPRVVERKKFGKRKARRPQQWRKR